MEIRVLRFVYFKIRGLHQIEMNDSNSPSFISIPLFSLAVKVQMEELRKTVDNIKHKCNYYRTTLDTGTKDIQKNDKIRNSIFNQ